MIRKIAVSSSILCLALTLGGCGGGATTTMQGVNIELPPTKEVLRDTRDRFETREFKVSINSGKLVINSMTYGTVQKGDKVSVSADSIVTVNGTVRPSN